MMIDVALHAGVLRDRDLSQWRTVAIDVVRASTTIAQALASGARRVVPVVSVEAAQALKAHLPSEAVLLGGERRGLPPPGFDLGNSPTEYTPAAVAGRTIVFTTTNGTRAILETAGASEALIGAFVNLPAVVASLARSSDDVLLVAAGRQGAPVLDDVVCAGMYADRLAETVVGCQLSEAAESARSKFLGYRDRVEQALRQSPSGQALIKAGLGVDLAFCARVGVCDVVPRLARGEIRAA